ncbi:MAG: phosphoribosylanthranilate isomerase [Acidobacteriota bacterium]
MPDERPLPASAAPGVSPQRPPDAPQHVRIKVCCIADTDEAARAIAAGVDAIGLVSAMPSGPGVIDEATIANVARTTPPGVASFLLTRETAVASIVAQQRRCGAGVVQLCGGLDDPAALARLHREAPGIAFVPVVHVDGMAAFDEARRYVDAGARALLIDSGSKKGAVPRLGGTGEIHDWRITRRIRDDAGAPIYLAGGLNPANVADAIRAVRPFGVDVCSGLRVDGRLDDGRLGAFVRAVGSTTTR